MKVENNNNLEFKGQKEKNQNMINVEQFLSQRFSCEILFNLLSSGEKCVYHNHKDRKYRYYDPLMTAKSKGQDELELEFRNQLRCFQACFIDDVENGGFRYPDNLNKQDIIQDVKKWMKFAKMGNRDILYKTYEKFISLLEEEKKIIIDIIKTNNNYNGPNAIDKGIFKGFHKKEIQYFINSELIYKKSAFEMDASIKKDFEKGEYSIKAILYHEPPHIQIEIFGDSSNSIKLVEEKKSNNSNRCC